ncbi:PEP-CTERM sorting domain-containing protein [Paucibacter sp. TC2R-5]|uniref:PEP-CTERM sorting domain-containing protein n=1 Tax=Paucibacter sp. TC2R-5 TaxID=2893555 RepID=UPI0021E3C807|nr:PEP-CTERM sorting domain-containing protein [Paucibacter sp. TC2R-5]MCV2359333.1 PEP-CTERM sorting domain-containing protein [Paucibacter sp. TC2R-5]
MSTTFLPKAFVFSTLAAAAMMAQAGYQMEVFAPPVNHSWSGLAAHGAGAVTASTAGNLHYSAASGLITNIGGNSAAQNFGGSTGISANGLVISSNATAANGFSQAATYSTATQSWTTLGSLGVNSNTVIAGSTLKQQSMAFAISADGSAVAGQAFYSAAGTPSSVAHAVVFKNGSVIDLTPTATVGAGRAFAISDQGSVVAGTLRAGQANQDRLWQWNAATNSYAVSTPTVNNAAGTAVNIQVAALSANGKYGAGGSINGLATNYAPPGSGFTMTYSQATFWDVASNSGKLIPFDAVPDFTNPAAVDLFRNNKAVVTGVSDNGLVIGSFSLFFPGTNAGTLTADTWIYDNNSGVTKSFDGYLTDIGMGLGADKHVWSLTSMAADGSAISGLYFDKATGTTSAFILHTTAVPEPATVLLFALALPLLMLRRAAKNQVSSQVSTQA